MRSLAKRLIVFDARENNSDGKRVPDPFQVCEKLRPQLTNLMGTDAFRALLGCALARASSEVPALHAVQVSAAGTLEVPEAIAAQIKADGFYAGRIAVVAQMFGLLTAFIGEHLTISLAREIWPKAGLEHWKLKKEDDHKTKK